MKKIILFWIFTVLSLIFLAGAIKMYPNLRVMGVFAGFLVLTACVGWSILVQRKWNGGMWTGAVLASAGALSAFGATPMLPDWRPVVTMGIIFVVGLVIFFYSSRRAGEVERQNLSPKNKSGLFYWIAAGLLVIISILLFPQINWQYPKDPAAVMILALFSAALMLEAARRNHPAKKLVGTASWIFIVNFAFVKVYEAGVLDFLGRFYRLFQPVYQKFDGIAEAIEWTLIIITVMLLLIMSFRRVQTSTYGRKTLWYFVLMPVMAIFLFEMLGLPAGFLAGATTRSDLLVTDTNAVMSTFGIVFIAVVAYQFFILFPFWVAGLFAGAWWVLWKPWFLHHPDPAGFTSFAAFFPAARFLFLTGLKRVVLPMAVLIGLSSLRKKQV